MSEKRFMVEVVIDDSHIDAETVENRIYDGLAEANYEIVRIEVKKEN